MPGVPQHHVAARGQDTGPDAPALCHTLGDGDTEFDLEQCFHVDDQEADERRAGRAVPVVASHPNSSGKASSMAPEMPPMGTVACIPA